MEPNDNWVSDPRKLQHRSSLSRTHSGLLQAPYLLLRQQTQYIKSPRQGAQAAPKHGGAPSISEDDACDEKAHHLTKESNISGTGITIHKEDHITPDWYHLALVRLSSKENKPSLPQLETQQSVQESELRQTCEMIQEAVKLRTKWVYKNYKQKDHIGSIIQDKDISLDVNRMKHILPKSMENKYSFKFVDGVAKIYDIEDIKEDEEQDNDNDDANELFETYSFDEYISDLQFIYKLMAFGPAKTLCYNRLKILQCRFKLHLLLNNEAESTESHSVPYRDFYNVRKIDNHIHHSACMHQKHLLRFMKDKYRNEPNKIVTKDNKTLKQVFDELGVNVEFLSVDKLDVHAQQATFQRFDKFNAKYNPIGM